MRNFTGATYFTMKGGLNSEASPLNIPPQDATALSNIDINIDGSIERRRAINFLGQSVSGNLYRTSNLADYSNRAEAPTFTQFNPINDVGALQKHVVLHFGDQVLFFDYDDPENLREIDSPKHTESVDGNPNQAYTKTTFLKDQNKLFIVNKNHSFGYFHYDGGTDTFTWNAVDVQVRDNTPIKEFATLDDFPAIGVTGTIYFATDTTTTYEWDGSAYVEYDPGFTVETGDNGDSTIIDVIAEESGEGFSTGCMAGSRVWLSGAKAEPNTLYYSQTIVDGDEHGKMYQAADPFSTADNLLVDTDGGTIQLTGAEKILALAPLGVGVIAFATNGIWSIAGQDGFRPTSYSINKISDVGIVGPEAWCAVEQQLVFFGHSNVYTILLGTSIDTPEVKPIGDKIVNFYNDIPQYNLEAGKAVYNRAKKKVYFFTNFTGYDWQKVLNPINASTTFRDALVMDVRLNAWSSYSLSSDEDGNKASIGDALLLDGGAISIGNVVDESNELVTDESDEVVTAQTTTISNAKYIPHVFIIKKNGTSWDGSFGQLEATGVVDFAESDTDIESNSSYITMAHQVFKDIAHKKFAPYIIPIFKRIESGVLDGNGVDLTPGGCKYRVSWDWANSSNHNKYGELRDAYKPYKWNVSNWDGTDPGTDFVTSRLKIRGRGEVLRLHFESDEDKDFKLYGWQLMLYFKGRV